MYVKKALMVRKKKRMKEKGGRRGLITDGVASSGALKVDRAPRACRGW